jgi:hypothetical protein
MVVLVVGIGAGGVGMFLLLFQKWLPAAILGGLFLISIFGGTVVMRRADAEELRRRHDESERFVNAWARGMASAGGAWRTHPRRKRSAGE